MFRNLVVALEFCFMFFLSYDCLGSAFLPHHPLAIPEALESRLILVGSWPLFREHIMLKLRALMLNLTALLAPFSSSSSSI